MLKNAASQVSGQEDPVGSQIFILANEIHQVATAYSDKQEQMNDVG